MSDAIQALRHELHVRQQIIEGLQAERDRLIQMVDQARVACQTMQQQSAIVVAQTHGTTKALLLQQGKVGQTVITAGELARARDWRLEVGSREGLNKGDLSFLLRPCTDEERQQEEALRNRAAAAEKKIITP